MATARNTLGFVSAGSRPLSDQIVAGPDVGSTMLGYFLPISLGKVVTTVVNHQVVRNVVPLLTMGVVMPLKATELEIKPEGERKWVWKKIFATPDLTLRPDDIIVYKGVNHIVMGQADWSVNGMVKYDVIEDYRKVNPV